MSENISINEPSVFFVGPERTGTTWIYQYLSTRNEVLLPKGTKETFFFDKYYSKGFNWYTSHFSHSDKELLAIEVAPTYFKSSVAMYRIKQNVPNAKIVFTLRNPYDRSISHINHLFRYGLIKNVNEAFLSEDCEAIFESLYSKAIANWINTFGKENTSILMFDDLVSSPALFVKDLCDIVRIDYVPPSKYLRNTKINTFSVPSSILLAIIGRRIGGFLRSHRFYWLLELSKKLGMKGLFFGKKNKKGFYPSEKTKIMLANIFLDDLQKLETTTSIDCTKWRIEMKRMIGEY